MKINFFVLMTVGVLFLTSCTNTANNVPVYTIANSGTFTFEECQDHGLGNNVIMIESKYCSHCRETRADFQAACDEVGITCEFWDVAEQEGLDQLQNRDVMIQFTPTMIYGCSYIVGGETKDEYVAHMQAFLAGE
jgi:hypothetical protein